MGDPVQLRLPVECTIVHISKDVIYGTADGLDGKLFNFKPASKQEHEQGDKQDIKLFDVMEVTSAVPAKLDGTYIVNNFRLVRRYGSSPRGEQMVLVTKVVTDEYIEVVGKSFPFPTPMFYDTCKDPPKKNKFAIGTRYEVPEKFMPQKMNLLGKKRLLYKYNAFPISITDKSKLDLERYFLDDLRSLTEEEERLVETFCKSGEDYPTLEEAKLYIRDPLIAISRFELEIERKDLMYHTVNAKGKLSNSDAPELRIHLTAEESNRCILSASQVSWMLDSELEVVNNVLGPQLFRVTEINRDVECSVVLKPSLFSRSSVIEIMRDRIKKTNRDREPDFGTVFVVGPPCHFFDCVAKRIAVGFERFYHNKKFFDPWCGWSAEIESNGVSTGPPAPTKIEATGLSLDPSQQQAILISDTEAAFTCIQSPPGCGKTTMVAALINRMEEEDRLHGRVGIAAITNAAATHGVVSVHKNFPEIKVVRDYSTTVEHEAAEEDDELDHSLLNMALNSDQYFHLEDYPELYGCLEIFEKRKSVLDMKKEVKSRKPNLRRLRLGQLELHQQSKAASHRLRAQFLSTYNPRVYGITASLLLVRGDPANNCILTRNGFVDLEGRPKQQPITHLILDEAAHMGSAMALALLCTLSHLEKVIVLGDSFQLKPFSRVSYGGIVGKLTSTGELTRLGTLNTVVQSKLTHIYRCHPRIVDLMLKPIYGEDLKSGLKPKDRDMAEVLNLPVAKDKSPCLFIDVPGGQCKQRVNHEEIKAATFLLEDMVKKGVRENDVVIIVHHRAQREAVYKSLWEHSTLKQLNIEVHTVDSFQGNEAKIVIVLTTKTLFDGKKKRKTPPSIADAMRFVSDSNRETVAVSRAQQAVYVFGSWSLLFETEFWSKYKPLMVAAGAMAEYRNGALKMLDSYDRIPVLDQKSNEDKEGGAGTDTEAITSGMSAMAISAEEQKQIAQRMEATKNNKKKALRRKRKRAEKAAKTAAAESAKTPLVQPVITPSEIAFSNAMSFHTLENATSVRYAFNIKGQTCVPGSGFLKAGQSVKLVFKKNSKHKDNAVIVFASAAETQVKCASSYLKTVSLDIKGEFVVPLSNKK